MTSIKKLSSIVLALVLILSVVTGCSKGEASSTSTANTSGGVDAGNIEEENFTLATTGMEGTSELFYLEEFARVLEELSGGKMTATVYPDAQLGGDVDTAESVLNGEIAGVTLQPSSVVTFVPEYAAFDYPNLFSGYTKDQIHNALSGEFFDNISDATEAQGLKVLSFAQGGSYRVATSNKPIETLDDFKGVKIRTLENPYHIDYWKSVGASPTPIAWAEVYISLQQGVVDAQENSYEVAYNGVLFEVQDYIINTNHILVVNVLMFSPIIYDALTPEQQAIVDEAAWAAATATNDKMEQSNLELRGMLEEKDVTFIDLSDEVLGQMKEKASGVYDTITNNIGGEYLESLQNGLEE